ncbi:tetratricopeptide repeat protein [Waterburya agarophytonicola K14]|uniref:Tetratricopeptide repeat protein n=1 Tax=Waterburya agarophytonicola KI4 TaxID=2874699 RepID=A0A964BP08_9CYAN|nr:tetratricopeptide repeat protein [Waterburya agarophytonicola]MCC0176634.1 tetratricopeptide repeat protein [Waterburya agarophytonicola KI4]
MFPIQYQNTLTNNDRWIVEHVFPNQRGKYFIEAGACNGIQASSCYVLEKYLEWTGICIEPNSSYFQELVKNRPHSICEAKCLAEHSGIVTYIQGNPALINPMLNGVKANLIEYKTNHQEIIQGGNEVEKEAITLAELLEKHHAPRVIHYLAMDIEGSELPVLQVFPFEQYQILAISIEGDFCNDLLVEKGYIIVKNPFNIDQSYEQFFLHESIFTTAKNEIHANHYLSLGNNFRRQKRVEEAISAYQQAINTEPNDSSIYLHLGNYQKEQGYLAAAIVSYQQAISVAPQQPSWVYYTLGNFLKKEANLDEALIAYQQAIELDSHPPAWLYASLGDLWQQQGKWDRALAAYEQAVELETQPAWVHRAIAQIWQQKQNTVAASAAYQRAEALEQKDFS